MGQLSKDTRDKLAKEDAGFYILTEKGKEGGEWDKREFLKNGDDQWARFKKLLWEYDLKYILSKESVALDMSYGVERITFAMIQDFSRVIGIDVLEVMINKAKDYQKNLETENVEFLVNNGKNLSSIPDWLIGFLFSCIALQHFPSSKQALAYVTEFSRVLKPNGVCLFQIRVSPTFERYVDFSLSKKIAKIKYLFRKEYHLQNAFMGNWIYYPEIYKIVSCHFSSFYLVQTPMELYQERLLSLKDEYERWKRSFCICIK